MESDVNSKVHRSPDDILAKGCAHTLAQIVCHNFRSTASVYIQAGVHNSVTFSLDHTLLMLALKGEERKKKLNINIHLPPHHIFHQWFSCTDNVGKPDHSGRNQ